ncbi:MAG: HAMP domain-containing protein [Elusimicrobia bacterium]|nr:HAMP domain-containing protein [Elusimicrobiota bacterium]
MIGLIQMRIVQGALEKDFEEVKSRLAERTAKSATDFIKSVTGLLATIGELDEISSFKKDDYIGVVRRVLESHPVIAELDIFDAKGRWVYGMERVPGSIPSEERPAELLPYVQETLQQLNHFRGNIVRVSGYPGVELLVPIRRRSDRVIIGYLRSIVSLLALSESLAETRIGKTMELFIVDYKNRLIAHSNYKEMFRQGGPGVIDPVLTDMVGKMGAYQNWTGRLELKDKRDIVIALHKIEDQPWIAGSLQERWEAFVVMIEMRQKLAEVIIAGTVALLFFALLFASRISSPVRSLTRAVRQIVASDFTQPVTEPLPKPANEIGELAQAFETMSRVLANRTQELMRVQDELKRFNVELEARVDARTKELKATQEELIKQERLAAIGQMASVVGHELRNPLSVINNSIYVIKSRMGVEAQVASSAEGAAAGAAPGMDSKIVRHVSIIEGELQVANQIISEILTFARTREIQPRDVELHEFLEEVLNRLQIPEKISLERLYAQQPISLKMDPDEVRQVVRNLIGNAFDAMPNGGRLTVGTQTREGYAVLSISDTGTGISPENVAKIFTPFFTTKSKGTGLGLSVVKKVMDRHNAEVSVDSAIGKGTTFHMKFPVG